MMTNSQRVPLIFTVAYKAKMGTLNGTDRSIEDHGLGWVDSKIIFLTFTLYHSFEDYLKHQQKQYHAIFQSRSH